MIQTTDQTTDMSTKTTTSKATLAGIALATLMTAIMPARAQLAPTPQRPNFVVRAPDLVIESIRLNIREPGYVSFFVTVRNRGNAQSGISTLGIRTDVYEHLIDQENPANSQWVHRNVIYAQYTPPLIPGQSREFLCMVPFFQHPTMRTGWSCLVYTDSEYQVWESNERNNERWYSYPR